MELLAVPIVRRASAPDIGSRHADLLIGEIDGLQSDWDSAFRLYGDVGGGVTYLGCRCLLIQLNGYGISLISSLPISSSILLAI
jgi:hypothetical protein